MGRVGGGIPNARSAPLLLLAHDGAQAIEVRDHLIRVGIDSYAGFITSLGDLPTVPSDTIAPESAATLENAFVLDVRQASEYADGHVPGATRIGAGRVLWDSDELPADRTIITYCQSGARNIVAKPGAASSGNPCRGARRQLPRVGCAPASRWRHP